MDGREQGCVERCGIAACAKLSVEDGGCMPDDSCFRRSFWLPPSKKGIAALDTPRNDDSKRDTPTASKSSISST